MVDVCRNGFAQFGILRTGAPCLTLPNGASFGADGWYKKRYRYRFRSTNMYPFLLMVWLQNSGSFQLYSRTTGMVIQLSILDTNTGIGTKDCKSETMETRNPGGPEPWESMGIQECGKA